MKHIVICADGTWNSPEQPIPTNVLRISRAVAGSNRDGHEQIVFYDWGIGSYYNKVGGGLTGAGLEKNICDCYRFIVHNYQPGDKLYFFGFSRGAFTVRSLAGFIRNCGIIKQSSSHKIDYAFHEIYKKRGSKSHPNGQKAVEFRDQHAVADRSDIAFVGVFDTVGALGVPVSFWGLLDNDEHLFHDLEPSSIVQVARHAVAIDEVRKDYQATLWDQKEGIDLQQVWFSGNHSDIGGGYSDHRLADIALTWMIDQARLAGLNFAEHISKNINPDPFGQKHNEFKKIFKIRGRKYRKPATDALFHPSVIARLKQADFGSLTMDYHLKRHSLTLDDLVIAPTA